MSRWRLPAMDPAGHVMAVILAAAVGVRPGQVPPPAEDARNADAHLIADLELIRMLDLLRDMDAIRQMDEMMGPARADQKARPGKAR